MAYSWGWDEEKFLNSTVEYFYKTSIGKSIEFERVQRAEWERLRILGAWVLQPHAKKNKTITPRGIMTFPWDKKIDWRKENQSILDECKLIDEKWQTIA